MKPTEVVVLSGKGGTGKTSVTAAFAALADGAVIADCDVDAPDMHLILQPQVRERAPFVSGYEATIDPGLCRRCGRCAAVCRFGAIMRPQSPEQPWRVDSMFCEGCGACERSCSRGAIRMSEAERGAWMRSDTRFGPLLHAEMAPGAENSGKLVALLRQRAREVAAQEAADIILCDGPPGIGCPAIATMTGADHVVFVAEPSESGLHDLERVVNLAARFRLPGSLFINKADLSPEHTLRAERFAADRGLTLLGSAAYSTAFTEAQVLGQAVTEGQFGPASEALTLAWRRLNNALRAPRSAKPEFRML